MLLTITGAGGYVPTPEKPSPASATTVSRVEPMGVRAVRWNRVPNWRGPPTRLTSIGPGSRRQAQRRSRAGARSQARTPYVACQLRSVAGGTACVGAGVLRVAHCACRRFPFHQLHAARSWGIGIGTGTTVEDFLFANRWPIA